MCFVRLHRFLDQGLSSTNPGDCRACSSTGPQSAPRTSAVPPWPAPPAHRPRSSWSWWWSSSLTPSLSRRMEWACTKAEAHTSPEVCRQAEVCRLAQACTQAGAGKQAGVCRSAPACMKVGACNGSEEGIGPHPHKSLQQHILVEKDVIFSKLGFFLKR